MTASALHDAGALVRFLETNRDRLTIDADTHITDLEAMPAALRQRRDGSPDYYHGRPISAEELVGEMDQAGVDMALCWQNPAATAYVDDEVENFRRLRSANAYVRDAARRHPGRIIPGGWTDPRALGLARALELVDLLVLEFGFLFVKLNPAQNRYPIDSGPVMAVVERIVGHGAIPAFHFGADTGYTPAIGLERVAERFPEHPVLAVHMGGGGAGYLEAEALYHEARELGLRRPNLRYALSARRDTHMESDLITYQAAGAPFSRNLFCASDAPYGRMTWNFGGFRAMLGSLVDSARHPDARLRRVPPLFTPETIRNFLGRNFAEFALAGYRHLLRVQCGRETPIEPLIDANAREPNQMITDAQAVGNLPPSGLSETSERMRR